MQVVSKRLMFSNTLYSVLKVLTQVILPAVATLYVALAAIWSFGYVSQVVGTITALVTFLGVSLHLSSANYVASGAAYNGTISITPTASGSTLAMHIDPNDVADREAIHLQVVRPKVAVTSDPPPPTPVTPTATPAQPLPPTGPVGG